MWVECHQCNGTGFKDIITKFNYRLVNNIHNIDIFDTIECRKACELCNNDTDFYSYETIYEIKRTIDRFIRMAQGVLLGWWLLVLSLFLY